MFNRMVMPVEVVDIAVIEIEDGQYEILIDLHLTAETLTNPSIAVHRVSLEIGQVEDLIQQLRDALEHVP